MPKLNFNMCASTFPKPLELCEGEGLDYLNSEAHKTPSKILNTALSR